MVNEIRLGIYELLFSKPLFRYATNKKCISENNILLLGNYTTVAEAFKAVFWCGQYSENSVLNITVASEDIDSFRQLVSESMPAMEDFPSYADIRYIKTDNMCRSDGLDCLNISENKYSYIIVAMGDNSVNNAVAEKLKDQISGCNNYPKKVIISIFSDNTETLPSENVYLTSTGTQITIHHSGEKKLVTSIPERVGNELDRLAFNIHITYIMEQNQRINILHEKEKFYSNIYASDSSYACAVHIPYKLAMCGDFNADCAAMDKFIPVLQEAISKENELYNRLISIEHRRWIAYMITQGYKMPSETKMWEYAYKNGNDHRNHIEKLHPCMCECGANGFLSSKDFELQREKSGGRTETISPLDKVSLLLNRIATERAKPVTGKVNEYFMFTEKLQTSKTKHYENLKLCTYKLCANEKNSIKLFESAMIEAQAEAEISGNQTAIERLKEIEKDFSVVKIRNKQTDFIKNDAALINRLPFCLWYGTEYKTVITVTNGVLSEDVIVPVMLNAQKAVFVGDFKDEDAYKVTASQFFAGRGGNTEVCTVNISFSNTDMAEEKMTEILAALDKPVINCIDMNFPEIFFMISKVASINNCPVVKYNSDKGIITLMNSVHMGLNFTDRSFSVDEFVNLHGGNYKNIYKCINNFAEYDVLKEIFKKYSQEITYTVENKNVREKKRFIPWNALSNFFQSAVKSDRIDLSKSRDELMDYRQTFSAEVFENCDIGVFLNSLSKFRVIDNLSVSHDSNVVVVRFDYVDAPLKKQLDKFALYPDKMISKKIKFEPYNGQKGGGCILISSTIAENITFIDVSDHYEIRKAKYAFLKDLENNSLIHNVEYSDDKIKVSFAFRSESIRQLFSNQGKILELIIYNEARRTGSFDDVQTGVEIAWDLNFQSYEELLMEALRAEKRIGNTYFAEKKSELNKTLFRENSQPTGIDNEIDVILIKGMRPIFISCKTGKKLTNDWLHEIASISAHFKSQPVLVVLKDMGTTSAHTSFIQRAKRMGVSLIGTETLFDSRKMQYVFSELAANRTVYGDSINIKTI